MRVAGIPAAIAAAMMAPVEVPATNEKVSRVSRPVLFSSLARATAGMMPRIPPPSIDNNLRRGITPPSASAGRWPPPINKYEANRSSVHLLTDLKRLDHGEWMLLRFVSKQNLAGALAKRDLPRPVVSYPWVSSPAS